MSDCNHVKAYYSIENDNYYCCRCRQGMGLAFYDMASALNVVAGGIWRNKEMNACGLSGEAIAVQLVERAMKRIAKRSKP